MNFFSHLFAFLPQLSNDQWIMTAVVWVGCYLWRMSAGFKVPAVSRVDKCLGMRVTPGCKVPGARMRR